MCNSCAASITLPRLAGLWADLNFARVNPRQCWPDTISLISASNKNLIWILNTFLVIDNNFFFLEILYFIVRTFKVMAEFGSPSTLYCKLFFRPNSFTRKDEPQFQATPAGQVLFRSSPFDDCLYFSIYFWQCWHYKTQALSSHWSDVRKQRHQTEEWLLPLNSKLMFYDYKLMNWFDFFVAVQ